MESPARITEAATALPFTKEEIKRYSRHLIMPEVTLEGQRKLKAARVLCIGTGGLGSPLLAYLAAAGVGRIGVMDFDVVDFSNLQRQIIHSTSSVGIPKVTSAKQRIHDINPYVQVDTHEVALNSENALELFEPYDVIVDGTDNFPTRYLVNDACALLGKPNVYGSIFRFEGQLTVFWAKHGPCYRCLYPEPPPPGEVPSCAEGGVLGVLPGIVGVLQALETIKIILGIGDLMIGRLLLVDALKLKFRELKLRKNPTCPLCGEHPTVTKLIDYEQFCGMRAVEGPTDMILEDDVPEITAREVKARLDAKVPFVLLDVREPHEAQIAAIPGSQLVPVGELPRRLHEFDSSGEIVVYCKDNARSIAAIRTLQHAGFRKLLHLRRGIAAWADEVDPSMPKY